MEEADEITSQQEEEVSQADLGKMAQSLEDKLFYKNQKRKTKWGPTLRAPRPRRSSDDGRTIMEKAQDLKKAKNLEKGNKHIASFAFESNAKLLKVSNAVNISLRNNTCLELEKLRL